MTKEENKEERYFEAVGRRKTASARVRIYPGAKETSVLVNNEEYKKYFKDEHQREEAVAPFNQTGSKGKLKMTVIVKGGGLHAQSGAVSLGLARALVKFDESLRLPLRKEGLLTRDSRMVERKKYGLKKARRAPQWAKR
jgi:small subunit ribosomal protein S9